MFSDREDFPTLLLYSTVLRIKKVPFEYISWALKLEAKKYGIFESYRSYRDFEKSELMLKGIRGCVGLKLILDIYLNEDNDVIVQEDFLEYILEIVNSYISNNKYNDYLSIYLEYLDNRIK